MSKRGPKIGDAVSLWNFAPSPGFTKEEVVVLKYCLMYYGVGRWVQILDTGLLPGKLIQQLNGQTQRLLGQAAALFVRRASAAQTAACARARAVVHVHVHTRVSDRVYLTCCCRHQA